MKTVPQPSTAAQPRALLYDRVSTARQAESGYSSGAEGFQIDLCRAHAERKGYLVVDSRTDVDSGAKWDVAGLLEAIDLAKQRQYDVLVVADSSRFARSLAKKLVYEDDLRRAGVRVEYTNLPVEDTAEGRLVANMFGAYDEYEREKIQWRTSRGRHAKAKKGQVVGAGLAPYGHEYITVWDDAKRKHVPIGLRPHPETAAIVRRIFREIRYYSATDIARRLTAEGVPTPFSRRGGWGSSTIRAILHHPAHRGEWAYGDVPLTLPYRLVDPDPWQEAQQLLAERIRRRRGQTPELDARYMLRGLLTCGHCGGMISTGTNSMRAGQPRQRAYVCLRHQPHRARDAGWERCELPTFDARSMEEYTWCLVSSVLLDPVNLKRHLALQQREHSEAWASRQQRLEVINAEMAKQERLLRRAVQEKLKVDEDDERYALYAQAESQAADTLARFRADRDTFAALPMPGLSEDEAGALTQFAEQMQTGVAATEPADRRRIFQTLRLRGRVHREVRASGIRIGRSNYLRIEWDAAVPLNSAHIFTKVCLLSSGSGVTVLVPMRAIAAS